MSGDEFMVLLASLVVALVMWLRWYSALAWVKARPGTSGIRLLMAGAPVLAFGGLHYLLTHWASHDVVGSGLYVFFYLVFGAAWVGLGLVGFSVMGLSLRDDVCERGNAASAYALAGGVLGMAAAFAGANVGDGPGWWCVAFAGGLATGYLLLGWAVLDTFGGAGHSVTVERDPASGIRLGAYLACMGFLLGRAAAGDWTSAARTLVEFHSGWPALLLTIMAVALERMLRPTKDRPFGSVLFHGILPALFYIAFAAVGFQLVGPIPDGVPAAP
jgi:hypothetical protein